jgi:hypothetical protein
MLPVPTDLECEWSLEYCDEGCGRGSIASTDGEWSIATQQIVDASKRLHRTKGYLRRAAFRRMPQLYRDGYEPGNSTPLFPEYGRMLSGRSFFAPSLALYGPKRGQGRVSWCGGGRPGRCRLDTRKGRAFRQG